VSAARNHVSSAVTPERSGATFIRWS